MVETTIEEAFPELSPVEEIVPEWGEGRTLKERREAILKVMRHNRWDLGECFDAMYTHTSGILTKYERRKKKLLMEATIQSIQVDEINEPKSTFSGDVQEGVAKLWEIASTDATHETERIGLWCLLHSVGVCTPGVYNHRILSKYEEEGFKHLDGVDEVTTRVINSTVKKSIPTGSSTYDKTREVVTSKVVKTGRLLERAKRIAEKTYRGFRQTQGLIAAGIKNRVWNGKLCKILYPMLKLQILRGWVEQLKASGLDESRGQGLVRQLALSIKIWAGNKEADEKEEDGLPEDQEIDREGETSEEVRKFSFVGGLISVSYTSECVINSGVCPFCVYHEVEGSTIKDVHGYSNTRNTGDLPMKASEGWIQAVARKHNKEMHAQNGNINSRVMIPLEEDREDSMRRDRTQGWDREPVRCIIRERWPEVLEEAEKYSGMSYFCQGNHGGRNNYSSIGTLHELAKGVLGVRIEPIPEGESTDPSRTRSGRLYGPAWSRRREGEIGRGLEQTWIGVGLDRGKHHGKIELTDIGEELNRAMRDPEDKTSLCK